MIDAMWFVLHISLVSIPLLHPCEHHPMQWVLSELFKNHEKLVSYDYLSWKWSYVWMTYLTQLNPKNDIYYNALRKSPILKFKKSQGISTWMVHEAQYLLRFCKWGSKLSGLDCGENSTVKRAWARGVLGWVTSWEVLVTGCKPRKWWLMLCDSFH